MYGKVQAVPQVETTPFWPRSPYAVAKVYAYWATVNYRESYGMHASNGILFNHESPRRGETFVTRKITRAVAHIKKGLQDALYLGNLDAKRDWGYAQEYVEGMWRMLQQGRAGATMCWRRMRRTRCRNSSRRRSAMWGWTGRKYVKHDARYERPAEVELLMGDPAKAKAVLGWEPKTKFKDLVRIMVDADIAMVEGRPPEPELECSPRSKRRGLQKKISVAPSASGGEASVHLKRCRRLRPHCRFFSRPLLHSNAEERSTKRDSHHSETSDESNKRPRHTLVSGKVTGTGDNIWCAREAGVNARRKRGAEKKGSAKKKKEKKGAERKRGLEKILNGIPSSQENCLLEGLSLGERWKRLEAGQNIGRATHAQLLRKGAGAGPARTAPNFHHTSVRPDLDGHRGGSTRHPPRDSEPKSEAASGLRRSEIHAAGSVGRLGATSVIWLAGIGYFSAR